MNLIKKKGDRKWNISDTILERETLRLNYYMNYKLK